MAKISEAGKGKSRLREVISSLDDLFKVKWVMAKPRKEARSPNQHSHALVALPSPPSGSDFRGPERPASCTLIRQIISHLFPADFLKPTPAAPTLHY